MKAKHESPKSPEQLKRELDLLRSFVSKINEESNEIMEIDVIGSFASDRLRERLSELQHLVFHDDLTGVYNRRGFFDRAGKLFTMARFAQREKTRRRVRIGDFAIIFIDLDNFKKINDTFGHDEGDRVLKDVSQVLMESARDIDIVGRLGGEEFIIALVGASEEEAFEKAECIHSKIKERISLPEEKKRVTGSVGIASLGASDADDLDELVGYADQAMYEAKTKRGKNTTVRFSGITKV